MSKKVLIVDDSIVIRNLLRKTLEKRGYLICGDAKNGKEGVEMFKEFAPDFVFMDITMPIMDGLEATKNIMGINPNAKIIMLSAMGDDEVLDEAKESGVSIFLKKPFNEFKIASALSALE